MNKSLLMAYISGSGCASKFDLEEFCSRLHCSTIGQARKYHARKILNRVQSAPCHRSLPMNGSIATSHPEALPQATWASRLSFDKDTPGRGSGARRRAYRRRKDLEISAIRLRLHLLLLRLLLMLRRRQQLTATTTTATATSTATVILVGRI